MTHNPLMRIYFCRLTIVLFLFISPRFGTSQVFCDFTTDPNEQLATYYAVSTAYDVVSGDSNQNSDIQYYHEVQSLDNQGAVLFMDANSFSSIYKLSGFNLDMPEGAVVSGVEVLVSAHASVDGVEDVLVQLNSPSGTSSNKANRALSGEAWSTSSWGYGSDVDLWSTMIGVDELMNPNFGVIVQYRNRSAQEAVVFIDHILIKVHYQAALEICGHPCVAFFTDDDPAVAAYNWTVPSELVSELGVDQPFIMNIFAEQSPFGLYEICLEKVFTDGQTDYCCRSLLYRDCSPATLGDYLWNDTNGNGMQDASEAGIAGYTINLFNSSNVKLLSATSDDEGAFSFENLTPGDYIVGVELGDMRPTMSMFSTVSGESSLTSTFFEGSTSMISLESGEQKMDVDLGLVDPSTACGRAYVDSNSDDTYDENIDRALSEVVVYLYNADFQLQEVAYTDAQGRYCFDHLLPADFILDFEYTSEFRFAGYGSSLVASSTADAAFTIDAGEVKEGHDLILYSPSTIGDFVWDDQNRNGIQDAGEPGLAGIEIGLLDCQGNQIDITTSDANGFYSFEELRSNDYRVCLSELPNRFFATINQADSDSNSDLAEGSSCTDCMNIAEGLNHNAIDLGITRGIGDVTSRVWLDSNSNDIIDADELGVEGIRVQLNACNGALISEVQTDTEGRFLFENVLSEDYTICIATLPAQYEAVDCLACFTVGNQDINNKDIALRYREASLGLRVYEDSDGDGSSQSAEPLVSGLELDLVSCIDASETSLITNGATVAVFNQVAAGSYFVRVDIPNTHYFNAGSIITQANGANTSDCFQIVGVDTQLEVGIQKFIINSTIGDRIWLDDNEDGVYTINESGLSNIDVILSECTGQVSQTVRTDANGLYQFSDVVPGEYTICLRNYDADYILPSSLEDSGCTTCLIVEEDQNYTQFDFGFTEENLPEFGIIQALSWNDENRNGQRESSEPLLSGNTISLYRCNGDFVTSGISGNNGLVRFHDQTPGEYYVQYGDLAGYDAIRGDVTDAIVPGSTDCLTLTTQGLFLEAGYSPIEIIDPMPGSIAGGIWLDENEDGRLDAAESGIAEVQVFLLNDDFEIIESRLSDQLGQYLFETVVPGNYSVQFSKPAIYAFTDSQVNGISSTLDSDVVNIFSGRTNEITLSDGQIITGVNAGFILEPVVIPTGQVSGFVWDDVISDDQYTIGDNLLNNISVSLYDIDDNLIQETRTQAQGIYLFDDVEIGSYYITFDKLSGYSFVDAKVGGSTDSDSEVTNLTTGRTNLFTVTENTTLTGVNAGMSLDVIVIPSGQVTGFVWDDIIADAQYTNSDDLLANISVSLYDIDDNLIQETRTQAQGIYLFDDVKVGSYYVTFDKLSGYSFVNAKVGGTSDSDSEVTNLNTGQTNLFPVIENTILAGINAGMSLDVVVIPTGEVTGIVWEDVIDDALYTTDDNFLSNVGVSLYDVDDNLIQQTRTLAQGDYLFEDVEVGGYYIVFDRLSGYNFVDARVGGNSDNDSEVTNLAEGRTSLFFITENTTLEGVNAGQIQDIQIVPVGSATGIVWSDVDANGLLDNQDVGLFDVTVQLYDVNSTFVTEMTTNAQGQYLFENINVGTYFISVEKLSGFSFTTYQAGGNSDVDSEIIDSNNGFSRAFLIEENILTTGVNAGLVPNPISQASISGMAWYDVNNNFKIGVAEDGVADIEVSLLDENNTVVANVRTSSDGQYIFDNVQAGSYRVQFSQENGYSFSRALGVQDFDFDSEVDDSGLSNLIALGIDENIIAVNAGYNLIPTGVISGTAWIDENLNNTIGVAELGVPDLQVSLYRDNGILESQVLTDAEGKYAFSDLYSFDYYVVFATLDGYAFALPNASPWPKFDSDVLDETGQTEEFNLAHGATVEGINAGFNILPTGAITGTVWIDENFNNTIGLSEPGVPDVQVTLYNTSGVLERQVLTDSEGKYAFTNLSTNDYYIEFALLDGYTFALPNANPWPKFDSDVIDDAGRTAIFNVVDGETVEGINAGFNLAPTGLITGTVWIDEDLNNTIGVSEPGVADIQVSLYSESGTLEREALTDVDGRYAFANLDSNDYYIIFAKPDGFTFALPNANPWFKFDSDVIDDAGLTAVFNVVEDETTEGVNAGLQEITSTSNASIAGQVWFDENENGRIGLSEVGVDNVLIKLYDTSGAIIRQTQSANSGLYKIENLEAGNYFLRFELLDGYVYTDPKSLGGASVFDSEVLDFDLGQTEEYALAENEELVGINAGFILAPEVVTDTDASMVGKVWEDVNGDGLISPGEPGLDEVTVYLVDSGGTAEKVTRTDTDGFYTFSEVMAGDYTISFELDSELIATELNAGQDSALNSDVGIDYITEVITVGSDDIEGVNAGVYYGANIGDRVWLDVNENGIQDIDEVGASNLILNLYDANGQFVDRAFTTFSPVGEPGFYQFIGLRPGDYYVQILAQQGVTFSPTGQGSADLDNNLGDANGPGSTELITVLSGQVMDDIDIGLILAPSSIGDFLWLDQNGDGIQDENEVGINGVTVELYNINNEVVSSTVTGDNNGESGYYLFEEIYPTEYYLKFLVDDIYTISPSDLGGVDSKDSDINNSNGYGTTSIFLLSPAEADLDIDGGVFVESFIGDRVWHDRNLDGLQDANEPGVRDVTVDCYRVVNGEDVFFETTTTNTLGAYSFTGLSNGDYKIVFTPNEEFEFTLFQEGNDSSNDSDASRLGVTDVITLSGNQPNADIDAGLVRPTNQIGGFAWLDINEDGLYSTDETFLKDITVWLMNDTGLVSEVSTTAEGKYLFDNLADGDYFIKIIPSSDLTYSTQDFGNDDEIDSDFDMSGETDVISLTGQSVFRHVDIGLIEVMRLSQIYPNPVVGSQLQLSAYSSKDDQDLEVTIINSSGGILKSDKHNKKLSSGITPVEVDIEGLNAGIYYLKVAVGRSVDYIKFIKVD